MSIVISMRKLLNKHSGCWRFETRWRPGLMQINWNVYCQTDKCYGQKILIYIFIPSTNKIITKHLYLKIYVVFCWHRSFTMDIIRERIMFDALFSAYLYLASCMCIYINLWYQTYVYCHHCHFHCHWSYNMKYNNQSSINAQRNKAWLYGINRL